MEIYFDRKTIRILRYIRWHRNSSIYKIQKKFGEDADTKLLINMCIASYLVCIRPDGSYTTFSDSESHVIESTETFWVTPKGRKILDDRFDRFWQWSIPTVISVVALVVSILSA